MRTALRCQLLIAALSLLVMVCDSVSACTVDSIPSATASGRLAIAFDIPPGSIAPSRYAPFIFPGSYGAAWPIRFGELSSGLTLTPGQMHARWRWDFGDHTIGWGHSVTHAYSHPGQYIVTVEAYDPSQRYPFPFDRVLVGVLAPDQILRVEGVNLLDGSRFDADAALRGGLLPLQREADRGLIDIANQCLGQIESGAWASIKDYWRHVRGSMPPAYARVDDLLQQEGAALAAYDRRRAAAIADELPRAWALARRG